MGEDKILHFIYSFGLGIIFLGLFFVFVPKLCKSSSRFWYTERNNYSAIFTLIFTLGFTIALTIGIWKEQFDSLGFGNVEINDFLADLGGVGLGVYVSMGSIRRQFNKRRNLMFQPQVESVIVRPQDNSVKENLVKND